VGSRPPPPPGAQRRERIAADSKAQLDDLAQKRRALHEQLDDRRKAQELLADVDGWKAQIDRTWDAWRRAEAIRKAGDGPPGEDLEEQRKLIEADEAEWATAKRIDEIQLESSTVFDGYLKPEQYLAKYPAAFAAWDLDLKGGDPAEVARRLRSLRVRTALLAALDHWAGNSKEDDPLVPRLLEVARLADPDPHGDRIRDPKIWQDRAKLLALAKQTLPPDVGPHLVLMLAYRVARHDNEAAVALMRRAILNRPRDFWLPFVLGNVAKDPTERIGCYRMALAVRPNNTAAQYNLGQALFAIRDLDGAVTCFERVLQIDPNFSSAYNGLGAALNARDDPEGAFPYIQKGLRLAPNHSLLHYNLGMSLKNQGKFAEAAISYQKAADLQASNPTWNVPAAQKAEECKRMAELDEKLPAYLAGARPRDAGEQLDLGKLCRVKKRYASAARFSAAALTADPRLAGAWGRFDVACAAALAVEGKGKEVPKDETEKADLRKLAMTWLDLELNSIRQQLEVNPKTAGEAKQKMLHWQKDADLASVRDEEHLEKLSGTERQEWRRLWGEVAALAK
jgi:tetratricopeptide (TPR) repeat protein